VSLTGLSIALLARFFVGLIWSATYLLLRQRAVARQSTAAAVAAELRATQAEVALRESELARLSQHVEPHFLFNALSAVLACRHEPDAVEAVTASLSEYLRFCLARGKDLEPLAHELDATEQLLSVHEARFEEDLRCSVGASPAARRIAVPPMVVAPLLDNALKFARQTSEPPWEISVTARMTDDRLILTVANSGSWVEPATDRPGTGLANLRRRLELSGIDFDLASSEGDGTVTVTLSLPATHPTSVP
jgi:two-component system, LytTR family, sensor kinase